jgi:anti-sigma28 factor (negative regulator of flagellin synthesis)
MTTNGQSAEPRERPIADAALVELSARAIDRASRAARIARLRRTVEAGRYRVDSLEIASRILDSGALESPDAR